MIWKVVSVGDVVRFGMIFPLPEKNGRKHPVPGILTSVDTIISLESIWNAVVAERENSKGNGSFMTELFQVINDQ